MAQLPTYDNQQVGPAPLPGVRQEAPSPALFVGAAAGADRLHAGMSDMGAALLKIQEEKNVDEVLKAENQLKAEYLEFDADIKKNRRGAFSAGVEKDTKKWWEEKGKKAVEGLGTDKKRQLFVNRMSSLRLQSIENSMSFEREHTSVAQKQTYRDSVATEIDVAVTNPSDKSIAGAAENIRKMNTFEGVAYGWSGETLNRRNAEDISRLHEQVINSLAVNQPDRANAYYEKYKGDITDSKIRTQLGKTAEHATAAITSTRAADEIFAAVTPAGGLDVMEARARKLFENQPATLKMTLDNLKDRVQSFRIGQAARADEVANPLITFAMQGASPEQLRARPEFAGLRALGVDGERKAEEIILRAQREQQHRANMALTAENRAYTAERRSEAQLDARGEVRFLELSDPSKLAAMTRPQVAALYAEIGTTNTQKLLNRYDELKKPGNNLAEARLDDNQFKEFAAAAGLKPFAKHPTEQAARQLNKLRSDAEEIVVHEQQKTGKPLGYKERGDIYKKIIDNSVIVQGVFSNTVTPLLTLTPEDQARVARSLTTHARRNAVVTLANGTTFKMNTIPREAYIGIVDALLREKIQATEENIIRAWQKHQSKTTGSW